MLQISDRAAARLQEILANMAQDQVKLRLFLDHRCHCGASHFSMALDAITGHHDTSFEVKGVSFLADRETAAELDSIEIDYVEDWMHKGFIIRNVNHQCGGTTRHHTQEG